VAQATALVLRGAEGRTRVDSSVLPHGFLRVRPSGGPAGGSRIERSRSAMGPGAESMIRFRGEHDCVAAVITQDEDLNAGLSAQAFLDVQLDQLALPAQRLATLDVPLAVHGPADVLGLDPEEIVRVDPPPGSAGVGPHYEPLVEFRRPDLPWLFTPVAGSAATGQKLRPWLALVVVLEEEAELVSGGERVSQLVCPVRELPEPAETWAWAHAQVVELGPEESVGDVLAQDPDRARSRVLSPRRLLRGSGMSRAPRRSGSSCASPSTSTSPSTAGPASNPPSRSTWAPCWPRNWCARRPGPARCRRTMGAPSRCGTPRRSPTW